MAAAPPTDTELRAFLLGRLTDSRTAEVESFLTEHPDQLEAAAVGLPSDTLVELLASARTRADAARAAAEATPGDETFTRTFSGVPHALAPADAPPELADHPKYRPVRLLGSGGMGAVWLAEHLVMGRQVALKFLRAEGAPRPGAVERFRREVRAAARLSHENIVTAFDAEQIGDRQVLVLEFVPGETLADAVKGGPLPVHEACRAARDAARGLAHAHAAGLVHRDVKPSNLMRTPEGVTKVLDFGLAALTEPEGMALTGGSVLMGTADYVAPEQAEDPRAADARSDLYSLGCTLYHLLAGRVPFPVSGLMQKIDAHRDPHARAAPLPELPAGLAALVARLMAKNPADRFATAAEVALALEPYCVAAPQRKPKRRSRALFALAAGLLLALVGGAAVVYKVKRDNEEISISTDDPDIEVVMKRNGELVRIVDAKTKQAWELDTKKMRLKPDGGELSIDLPERGPLVLRRNGDAAVTIRREPAVAAQPIPKAPPTPRGADRIDGTRGLMGRIAYHPSGDRILSSGQIIAEWDPTDGKMIRKYMDSPGGCWCATYSRDGKKAAAFATDNVGEAAVHVWDTATGNRLAKFVVEDLGCWWEIDFSADGKTIYFAFDTSLHKGDIASGKSQLVAREACNEIRSVAVSPDGKLGAVAWTPVPPKKGASCMRVWDLTTGKPVREFKLVGDSVHILQVRWTQDGKRPLTANTDGVLREWDTETAEVVRTFTHGAGMAGFALSPDGSTVFVARADSSVGHWDLRSGKQLDQFASAHRGPAFGVAFHPKGRSVATCGRDGIVCLWQLPAPTPPPDRVEGPASKGWGLRVVHHPTGDRILASNDGLNEWNPHTGKHIRKLSDHSSWGLRYSKDGKLCAAVTGGENALVVWDATTGKEVARHGPIRNVVDLWGLDISPDNKTVYYSASQVFGLASEVHRFDIATQKTSKLFEEKADVRAIACSPDGELVAHGLFREKLDKVNSVARIRDAVTGKIKATLQSTEAETAMCLEWLPGGKRVAIGTTIGDVLIWNAETDKVDRRIRAHVHGVEWLSVSRDGTRVMTAGHEGNIGLWDIATGQRLAWFAKAHDGGGVLGVSIHPDGRSAASCGQDGIVRLWRLPDQFVDPKKK